MTSTFAFSQLADRAAWTLMHFVWQGALIAAITAGLLQLLRRHSARMRYAVAIFSLAGMIAAPGATFAFYAQAETVSRALLLRLAAVLDPAAVAKAVARPVMVTASSNWTIWVLWLWIAGVAMSSLRIAAGWRLTRRLLRETSDLLPEFVTAMMESLKFQLALSRPVFLRLSESIDGPAVIGWMRPVVLLPVRALTGLDEGQLRAVLAHELAHVARHDFFVNVLQQCVESLLFYHPAVWWLSRRIRTEREHVCDDLAVAMCGDPAVYAKALMKLEHSRSSIPQLAMTASRGSLKARIRRIFGWAPAGRDWREAATAAMFMLTVFVALMWQTRGVHAQNALHPASAPSQKVAVVPKQDSAGPLSLIASTLVSLAPAASQAATPAEQAKNRVRIEGTVVNTSSGEAIPGAHITVTPDRGFAAFNSPTGLIAADREAYAQGFLAGTQQAAGILAVTADEQGRFIVPDLEAGAYRVTATAAGFVRREYGQRSPSGPGSTLILDATQASTNIVVRMVATSSISGLIRTANGRPAVDVPVRLLQTAFNAVGQRTIQVVGNTRTDDRGQYRLFWLTPGHYLLAAGTEPSETAARGRVVPTGQASTLSNNPEEWYAVTYYPGVSDITSAGSLEVAADAQVNADFVVSLQKSFRISGRVIDTTTGKPPVSVTLSLIFRNLSGGNNAIPRSTRYSPDTGEFEFQNVPAGDYNVQANVTMQVLVRGTSTQGVIESSVPLSNLRTDTGSQDSYTAGFVLGNSATGRTPVSVSNSDVRGIVVSIVPTITLTGKLRIDGITSPADLRSLRIQLRPSVNGTIDNDTLGFTAPVAADGSIQFDKLKPGEYRLTLNPFPTNYYLREVRLGGVDALNKPMNVASASDTLEVVLSLQPAEVSGSIVDEKQQPVRLVQAVLVPDQHRERYDLFRAVNTDANGRFSIKGLPPGDYKIYSWESIEPFGYFDPERLKLDESRGQQLHLQEGSRTEVTVKWIPAP